MKFRLADFIILSIFTILITFQPYYLHGEINEAELGIYLPGINAILDGQIPFRDFFHLRGPLELYMPAFCMALFGESVGVLATYFYVGTIFTFLVCILIGQRLYRTRLFLYFMVPVLVARTFPRVVFTYWGGMRFVLGLSVILFAVQFFKCRKRIWIFAAGGLSFLALITSIEIGVCAILGVMGTLAFSFCFRLESRSHLLKSGGFFLTGILSLGLPYLIYLTATHSLFPYLESVYAVVTNMQKVINLHFVSSIPGNFNDAIIAMVNPLNKNFRHMTPAYLYLFLAGYLVWKTRHQKLETSDQNILCLGIYGFVLYVAAFRSIWGSQFEMALQPDKLLLFILLERAFFFFKSKKEEILTRIKQESAVKASVLYKKVFWLNLLLIIFVGTTIGGFIHRYDHRFFAFKYVKNRMIGKETQSLIPLAQQEKKTLVLERAKGMTVPAWQAEDFETLTKFMRENTSPQETVFMFPEMGFNSFLIDRPFVGRFPTTVYSWFDDRWRKELISDLKETKPRFAVVSKTLAPAFEDVYFKVPKNKDTFLETEAFIKKNYHVVASTPSLWIYQWRE